MDKINSKCNFSFQCLAVYGHVPKGLKIVQPEDSDISFTTTLTNYL